MEIYNKEELISALIVAGYNKVDTLLCILVIDHIKNDKGNNEMLTFLDNQIESYGFRNYVEFDDYTYRVNALSLNEKVSECSDGELLVGDLLPLRERLVKYLINVDLSDAIIKKAKLIGINKLHLHADLFSNKEINIIKQEFGNEVFGELYNFSGKLECEDYKNMSDDEIYELVKDYRFSNYIYKFCLNEYQKEIASLAIRKNAMSKKHLNEVTFEDILDAYKDKETNSSVLISVCDAHSRTKKHEMD